MEILKREKGITLVALIITIVVMLILAGISIGSGTSTIESTRLEGFYTQMDIILKRVDEISSTDETYLDGENEVNIKEMVGTGYVTQEEIDKFNIIKKEINNLDLDAIPQEKFGFFSAQEVEKILDLSDIDQDVFIDFENKIVISANGIEVKGKKYYLPKHNFYFVNYVTSQNNEEITLSYSVNNYYNNLYKVNVVVTKKFENVNGYIKYKKSTSKYWDTSNDLQIVIEKDVNYDIIYQDINGNKSIQEKILVSINEESLKPEVIKVED